MTAPVLPDQSTTATTTASRRSNQPFSSQNGFLQRAKGARRFWLSSIASTGGAPSLTKGLTVGLTTCLTLGLTTAFTTNASADFASISPTSQREITVMSQAKTLMDWRQGLGFAVTNSTALLPNPIRPSNTSEFAGSFSSYDPDNRSVPDGTVSRYILSATTPSALQAILAEISKAAKTAGQPANNTSVSSGTQSTVLSPTSAAVSLTSQQAAAFSQDSRVLELAAEQEAVWHTNEDAQGNATPSTVNPNPVLQNLPTGDLRNQQWALDTINIQAAHAITQGNKAIKVAIVDSGVWSEHPNLKGQFIEHWQTGSGNVKQVEAGTTSCGIGHGTNVAGVVAAIAPNQVGITGVAPGVSFIDINAVETEPCKNGPTDSSTIAAINLARERGADVIIMSFGFRRGYCSLVLQQAIDEAYRAGIIIVAASGNQGLQTSPPEEPASCNNVISVGASGSNGQPASYSTYSPWVDVMAPGGDLNKGSYGPSYSHVLTTNWADSPKTPNTMYVGVTGTSFATPHVAGLAALIRSIVPQANPNDVARLLETTARRTSPEHSDTSGWGMVTGEAVARAKFFGVPHLPPLDAIPYPVGRSNRRSGPGHRGTNIIATSSDPIDQSIQISQQTFRNATEPYEGITTDSNGNSKPYDPRGHAQWAVLARQDVHADSLAGATLSLGAAPLLFTSSAALAPQTAAELTRTLQPGATVYILGKQAALSDDVLESVRSLGFNPVRVGGATREETAVEIAKIVQQRLSGLSLTQVKTVLIANRDAWPDAIGAGFLGAHAGLPVLLTQGNYLSPATKQALADLAVEQVILVGGTTRLTNQLQAEMTSLLDPDFQLNSKTQSSRVLRLSGSSRTRTLVQVSSEIERTKLDKTAAIAAVNIDETTSWPTVLSATVPAAAFNMIPVAVHKDFVDDFQLQYVRGLGLPVVGFGSPSTVGPSAIGTLETSSNSVPNPYPR